MRQNGSQVSGDYMVREGRFSGTGSGSGLRGTFSQAYSYKSPQDTGSFELTMAANCKTFSGKRTYGDGKTEVWEGSQISAQP